MPREYWNPRGFYSHTKERILKPEICGTIIKYYRVLLVLNDKKERFLIHRLVYITFVGDIPDNMEVDHIDDDSFNNELSNLKMVTHLENNQKEHHNISRQWKTCKYKVFDIVTNEELIFNDSNIAHNYLHVSQAHIRNCAMNHGTTNLIKGRYKIEPIFNKVS